MTTPENGARSRKSSRAPRPEPDEDEPLGAILARVGHFVEDLGASFWSRVELKVERTKAAARRSAVKVALVVAAGIAGLVWISAALVAVMRGVCLGLAQLFGGREWLGDLVGGALVLAIVAGAAALALRRASRHDERRIETKEHDVQRARARVAADVRADER